MLIESGLGNGKLAAVDDDNRLLTAAFNIPFDHVIAKDYAKVFAATATTVTAAGTESVLVLRNNNQDNPVVPTRLSLQTITVTAIPATTDYFSVEVGGSYTSGGIQVTPSNTTSGSSVVSNVAVYYDNPTVAAGDELWRVHPTAQPIDYRFDGGLIIPPSQSLIVKYTGAAAATVVASISFSVVSASDYSG